MKIKSFFVQSLKVLAICIVMVLSFVIASGIAFPDAAAQSAAQSPEEAAQGGMALLLVSIFNALILAWPIARSRWHGLKLIGAMVLVFFSTQTFMSQIETVFFGGAFNISTGELMSIILSGLLTALFFTPLAVLIFGKMRKPKMEEELHRSIRILTTRVAKTVGAITCRICCVVLPVRILHRLAVPRGSLAIHRQHRHPAFLRTYGRNLPKFIRIGFVPVRSRIDMDRAGASCHSFDEGKDLGKIGRYRTVIRVTTNHAVAFPQSLHVCPGATGAFY